jgi:hypothetical protein
MRSCCPSDRLSAFSRSRLFQRIEVEAMPKREATLPTVSPSWTV